MIPIPKELAIDRNQEVLAYLSGASAHGDVAEELLKASSSLGDVGSFCPDTSQFLYVTIYTDATIFGCATGMNSIAFRLDQELKARAIATGANEISELMGWVSFEHFRSDWPSIDFKFWARQVYVQVRQHLGA